MSNCCSLMKDANPKVAQLALDAVEICINNSFQVFQPQANITFDLLISKFGDLKVYCSQFDCPFSATPL